MMISYKAIDKHHAEQVASLHTSNWQKFYKGILSDEYLKHQIVQERLTEWNSRLNSPNPDLHVIGAFNGDELIGFSGNYLHKDKTWGTLLDNLHVHPSFHKKGIGKKLMQETAKWLIDIGSELPLYLWVFVGNTQAISFYDIMKGRNVETNRHLMPDGSRHKCYRYIWDDLNQLI